MTCRDCPKPITLKTSYPIQGSKARRCEDCHEQAMRRETRELARYRDQLSGDIHPLYKALKDYHGGWLYD